MPDFDQFLGRTQPIQSDAEQNLVIFKLYKSSRMFSLGISLADNEAGSNQDLVCEIWNVICKETFERSDGS